MIRRIEADGAGDRPGRENPPAVLPQPPGNVLLISTMVLIAVTLVIPYLPYMDLLGFVPLPPTLIATLATITVLYAAAAEGTKRWFYRHAA